MNEFILIVLRSRTQVFGFQKLIKSSGIESEIVNTPKEIFVGCGLSIRINNKDFNEVKRLYQQYRPQSFVGFYNVIFDGYKNIILSVL
ncbi:MAG: DUF3343 domain-containing protein [Clostridiales bacterium]|nr:DUF3343 domain-containing protein [Clostridiales bacterium]